MSSRMNWNTLRKNVFFWCGLNCVCNQIFGEMVGALARHVEQDDNHSVRLGGRSCIVSCQVKTGRYCQVRLAWARLSGDPAQVLYPSRSPALLKIRTNTVPAVSRTGSEPRPRIIRRQLRSHLFSSSLKRRHSLADGLRYTLHLAVSPLGRDGLHSPIHQLWVLARRKTP